jgi:hypothetical protein
MSQEKELCSYVISSSRNYERDFGRKLIFTTVHNDACKWLRLKHQVYYTLIYIFTPIDT